jgi:hypothetical protein
MKNTKQNYQEVIEQMTTFKNDFEEAWDKIKYFGYATESNPEKDYAVSILQEANFLREDSIGNLKLEDGLSSLEYELDDSDTIENILSQFESIIEEIEDYKNKAFPNPGTLATFDNDIYMENLTKQAFIEKAKELAPVYQEVKENILDLVLKDTPYKNLETMFYDLPFANWSEEERDDIINSIENYSSDLTQLVEFTEQYDNSHLERFNIEYSYDSPEQLVDSLIHNLNIEMEASNFKAASHEIETIIDLYNKCEAAFNQFCPDIDLKMPSHWDSQIQTSAESYDLIYGVDNNTARGYLLENEPSQENIEDILYLSSDISLVESDGKYYIGFSSSEKNINATAVAYSICSDNGSIPPEIESQIQYSKLTESQKEILGDGNNSQYEINKLVKQDQSTNQELF